MINNTSKIKENLPYPKLVTGILPTDSNIEFAGIQDTKEVVFLQNGNCKYFSSLPTKYKNLLKNALLQDHKAYTFLKEVTSVEERQIELYTYYMYGDIDTTPDIENGKLTAPENFRDSENCPSLLWNKQITIDDKVLTPREILITDMFGKDFPDKAIATSLNISHPHLDTLKRKLFKKVGVISKTAYIMLAIKNKVIRC